MRIRSHIIDERLRLAGTSEAALFIFERHHPGQSRVYARVLTAGPIRTGDPVTFVT